MKKALPLIQSLIFIAVLLVRLPTSYGATDKPFPSLEETLKLGERMYREGILPSGEPMHAFVKGDLPVSGTAFTCGSCHLRARLGSIEGSVVTPPTNGPYLFKPFKRYSSPSDKIIDTINRADHGDDLGAGFCGTIAGNISKLLGDINTISTDNRLSLPS